MAVVPPPVRKRSTGIGGQELWDRVAGAANLYQDELREMSAASDRKHLPLIRKRVTAPDYVLNVVGDYEAPIVVVCEDPADDVYRKGAVMSAKSMKKFGEAVAAHGFKQEDFVFISPCTPIPEIAKSSDKRRNEHIELSRAEFLQHVAMTTRTRKLVVALGAVGGQQAMGQVVKIMKQRGHIAAGKSFGETPVLPMYSPAFIAKRPENEDMFLCDIATIGQYRDAGWRMPDVLGTMKKDYRWCMDLSELIANPPANLVVDIEGMGLNVLKPGYRVLVVSIGLGKGKAIAVPVDCDYYPALSRRARQRVIGQLKELMENPDIKKTGFNFKFDIHALRNGLGIEVQGFQWDAQQMVHNLDENMFVKNLAESTRRWVPAMAGYDDGFNKKYDKSRMDLVPHDDMLDYACGDVDATARLTSYGYRTIANDPRQFSCFDKVQMNALRAFVDVEKWGIGIDQTALTSLQATLEVRERELYASLIARVDPRIKRKHFDKGLSFGRDKFLIDILFGPKTEGGLGLKPRVWTDTTKELPNEADRIPSISSKTHLPFFNHIPFVADLMKYVKLQKLRTTYVGMDAHEEVYRTPKTGVEKTVMVGATGFWQYLDKSDSRIHPSFFLHDTVTGRTNSRDPNAQNFPKRGDDAKLFRRVFIPRAGYKLVEADLSQAELRIAALMANETNMLRIYAEGGDIHAATAAVIIGMTFAEFSRLPEEEREKHRQSAKAVNFGFLYGMGWKKFMDYAKTDYNVVFTEAEAKLARARFFNAYPKLKTWHDQMKAYVKKHGFVRALHGAKRQLPSIFSDDEGVRALCERQAVNSPVQRFASDIGLIAMARFMRDCNQDEMRAVAFIHDAVVLEVREDCIDEGMSAIKWYMENAPLERWFGYHPTIPITSDVSAGYNLGDMQKMKHVQATMPCWAKPWLD